MMILFISQNVVSVLCTHATKDISCIVVRKKGFIMPSELGSAASVFHHANLIELVFRVTMVVACDLDFRCDAVSQLPLTYITS